MKLDAVVIPVSDVDRRKAFYEKPAAAHGEHEARTGQEDANRPDWRASYTVAEHAGDERPS